MRVMGIHSKYFRYAARQKVGDGAEACPEHSRHVSVDDECLVIFVSVEKDDTPGPASVADQLAEDTRQRAEQLGVPKVVVYPYVHLTDNPSTPRVALSVLREIESRLARSLDVVRAPFGWYKSFEAACLGHPLSEWSARYEPRDNGEAHTHAAPVRKPSQFVRFVVVDLDGHAFDVGPDDLPACPVFSNSAPVYGLLRQLVSNELARGVGSDAPPKHIAYMRDHELVDYCDVSEKGHYKWYPKGLLIHDLLLDYARQLAREWGAFEMKNPAVIRGDHNVVGELMGEFHERDYQVDGGRGVCYLRYASDPLAFPFMQQVRFSYKQSPLKVYEEASCFRNERQGEVSGLKRVRNFTMTDMHAACRSVDQARDEFERLCLRFADLMNDIIAKARRVLGWEGTVAFYEENRDWLIGIGQAMGVPAFFKLMPEMSHYFAMKNEYQVITEDRSNVQISTVQWDVKDGQRFDIGFIDEHGLKKPCPVIIHASSFGSIERALCAILETIAIESSGGAAPQFPLWLAPTQVRILPVSERHVLAALAFCEEISRHGIRADVDDRDGTLGKKIRDGEKEWVPYLAVVGQREERSGCLSVRSREDRSQQDMSPDALARTVRERTEGMPYRGLPLPKRLSHRPIFFG